MANMFASVAVAIVAFAASVTPAFACAHEVLMTDAEIAAYKNGGSLDGQVAWLHMMPPNLAEPTKADMMDDVIARAAASLLAEADTTGAAAPVATPAPPAPEAASAPPARQFAQAEPERKRVVVTCSGQVYPSSTL